MAEENGLLLYSSGCKHSKLEMRIQNKNLPVLFPNYTRTENAQLSQLFY